MKTKTMLAMGLLLALLGCHKLTLENYSRIEAGMSYDEVTRLIGQPAQCDDVMGLRSCSWGDEQRSASVTFAGGKVVLYSSSNLQ